MTKYYLVKMGKDYTVVGASGKEPKNSLGEVPEKFSREDYPYLKSRSVEAGDVVINEFYIDETEKDKESIKKKKKKKKKESRSKYLTDIDKKMISIFGTTNRDKANSLFLTWMLMKDDPSYYIDKGLKDSEGNDLDSEELVAIYSAKKIEESKEYSVYLIDRKKELDKQIS